MLVSLFFRLFITVIDFVSVSKLRHLEQFDCYSTLWNFQ